MNLRRTIILCLFPLLIALSGCSSYISRIVLQSFGRIGETIPDPPHIITTAILPNANLAVSWAGHATVLIQICDKIIITDPFLTNTLGLVVKRYIKPGIDPALLTKVDATLISHIHLDHFSYGSLDLLPKNGLLAIPLEVAAYTADFGFKEVDELKPWQMIERGGVRITAVPVQHFGGRYGFDGGWMGTLGYTGYVVQYKEYTVFFAGDTGYDAEVFKEIGRRFTIDLAIIPIAPGSGSGFGSRVHVNPRGAISVLKDVGAKYMMPIHFNTLFYGPPGNPAEPVNRLREAATEQGCLDKVIILEMGEQRVLF